MNGTSAPTRGATVIPFASLQRRPARAARAQDIELPDTWCLLTERQKGMVERTIRSYIEGLIHSGGGR